MRAAADLRERARVAGGEDEGANRDRTRESYERTLSRGFPMYKHALEERGRAKKEAQKAVASENIL